MIKSKFNYKTRTLESQFMGEVSLFEIVNYIHSTGANRTYPRFLKIKTDATTANFTFSPTDLDAIFSTTENSLGKYDFVIDAIIVGFPRTTAISILYQELARSDNYKFNVFSTDEAASEWLDNY